jgi:hypothetical protein
MKPCKLPTINRNVLAVISDKRLDNRCPPIIPVTQQSQIRKRLFRRSCLSFFAREEITEFDQEVAVPFALVVGQGNDAGEVVT